MWGRGAAGVFSHSLGECDLVCIGGHWTVGGSSCPLRRAVDAVFLYFSLFLSVCLSFCFLCVSLSFAVRFSYSFIIVCVCFFLPLSWFVLVVLFVVSLWMYLFSYVYLR